MALVGFGMISLGNLFYSYVPWLVGIRPYSFPMAIALVIFGVALSLLGKNDPIPAKILRLTRASWGNNRFGCNTGQNLWLDALEVAKTINVPQNTNKQ